MDTRAKWAYLSYDSIQTKINEGVLDAYDIIYTKDSHENVIISPDLEVWSVRSRIYVFNSVEEANTQLNINTDTYVGQIVSVIVEDKCKGYIVNKDALGNYYVDKMTIDDIDYNTLGNRPIVNLIGDLDDPIIIDKLDTGIYNVKGQYKISNSIETIYLSASSVLIMVEKDGSVTHIKHITTDKIADFFISDNSVTSHEYITDQYLKDNNYANVDYVDNKIAALEQSINEDIEKYIADIVDKQFSSMLDEKIIPMSDSQIRNLF